MFIGGGGAFLISFLLMNFVLIYPILTLLISTGQHNSNGLFSMYSSLGHKFIGLALSKCSYIICVWTFYVYLLIYNIKFLVMVFFSPLPWLDKPISSFLVEIDTFFNEQILNKNSEGNWTLNLQIIICRTW